MDRHDEADSLFSQFLRRRLKIASYDVQISVYNFETVDIGLSNSRIKKDALWRLRSTFSTVVTSVNDLCCDK